MNLFFSLLIGAALGSALGYFGKCTTGACPLTANPWRGALYGAVLGLVFHFASGRTGGSGAAATSTAHVRLIQESQFEAEVTHSDKPVVVDFFATWCGPCKKLSPMLDDMAAPLTNRVKFVKVDVDQATTLARQYEIQAVPTLLIFEDGKVKKRFMGVPERSALQGALEALAGAGA